MLLGEDVKTEVDALFLDVDKVRLQMMFGQVW